MCSLHFDLSVAQPILIYRLHCNTILCDSVPGVVERMFEQDSEGLNLSCGFHIHHFLLFFSFFCGGHALHRIVIRQCQFLFPTCLV